ncbi:hypothetical protein N9K16_01960 [Alphaproteobacteria bacterium]|jgi:adenylate kinase family enzyme|nr:hypothetical protein [Alphaproteobacteria bacterium]
MPRFLVVGNLGSGHITTAQALATERNLPFVDLETIYWQPGWKLASIAERQSALGRIAERDNWVVAGQAARLEEIADEVIRIDRCKLLCLMTYLRQALPYLFRNRPGMPAHCPEILGLYPSIIRIFRFGSNSKQNS